jgi:F-type H+-transporting ATPase subunit epsilon
MINLKVVSPQKVIFEKEVEMAVLPGAEGDFAAMENHSPFISSLRPGQMAIMAKSILLPMQNNRSFLSYYLSIYQL